MSQRKNKTILMIVLIVLILSVFISGWINLQNAEKAYQNKDYTKATQLYVNATKIFFWQTNLWEKAGISAAQAGDYQNAILYFQKTNQLSEDGWIWLGTSYYYENDSTKAISVIEEAVKNKPSARLYSFLAFLFREGKNWQAEKSALENQLLLNNEDAYAHYRLGLLLCIFAPDQAFDSLTHASTLNLEVDSAAQTLITALNIADTQSNEAEKFVTIGRALGLVQAWDLALVAFEKAIAIDQKNAEAWAWLGEAKQQQGQDGSEELNQALGLKQSSAIVHALNALYWTRQNNHQQALKEYLTAIALEPDNPAWFVNAGEAYAKTGDLLAALGMYQRATELVPQDATYWRALALFCAENNIYIEEIALPAAQQAQTLLPNDPANLDALGYVYFLSSRFANAEIYFLQAIENSPNYYGAYLHLAMNYLAQGKRADAYNALTVIRDAESSGEFREAALQLLEKYYP